MPFRFSEQGGVLISDNLMRVLGLRRRVSAESGELSPDGHTNGAPPIVATQDPNDTSNKGDFLSSSSWQVGGEQETASNGACDYNLLYSK